MNRASFTALLLAAVVSVAAAKPSFATPQDYCAAYARDFADRGKPGQKLWDVRHANALRDCLALYDVPKAEKSKPAAPKAVKVAQPPPPKKQKAKPRPEPDVVETFPIDEALPEPAVIVAPDIPPPEKPTRKSADTKKPKSLMSRFFPKKGEQQQVVSKGKPVPGTAAWLDYCERKYASFNRETGTYTSFKGTERRCLVTN
jgi:BA14K-like protein